MKELFHRTKNGIHSWLLEHAESGKGMRWLAFVAYIESTIFILPADLVLITYISVKNTRWLRAGAVAGVFSTLGGLTGYLIGYLFFDLIGQPIIDFYHLGEQMTKLGTDFSDNNFWIIFISAFTPLPYKAFVISAGFFKINFLTFLIASFLGRTLRFIVVAYLSKLYGNKVARFIYKYFNIMAIAGIIIIIVGIVILLT